MDSGKIERHETNGTVLSGNARLILTLRHQYSLFLSVQKGTLLCEIVTFTSEWIHSILSASFNICLLSSDSQLKFVNV